MSIAALITEGIGPGGSVLYVMTGGLSIGVVANPWRPATPDTQTWNSAAASSGIWTPATPDSQTWNPA